MAVAPETVSVATLLRKDLRTAAALLGDREARYLVDLYYALQDHRIEAQNQIRALATVECRACSWKGQLNGATEQQIERAVEAGLIEAGTVQPVEPVCPECGAEVAVPEPNAVLGWAFEQHLTIEREIAKALDGYGDSKPVGVWSKTVTGIGPIIAAGLLAHIDITRSRTAGNVWRFAGLDPSREWLSSDRAKAVVREAVAGAGSLEAAVAVAAERVNADPAGLLLAATSEFKSGERRPVKLTEARLAAAVAKRPWNGKLKVLCWKIGESFVKVSSRPSDVYGKVYLTRKAQETLRNEAGEFADQARVSLETKNFGRDTVARSWYEQGKLPPARIHARSKRYAVKLFLAHWHHVAWESHFGTPPPVPYVIEHGGHVDFIGPPGWPMKAAEAAEDSEGSG